MRREWSPTLPGGQTALYDQIVQVLERDIQAGVVAVGARLPPQRTLAHSLGVSIGTVTKAYIEAEQRGLVRGHVGRGTFVEAAPEPGAVAGADQPIDLAHNFVPSQFAERRMAESVALLTRRGDLQDALSYPAPAGSESHRKAGAQWLSRIAGLDADWSQMVVTVGAQQAMSLAFGQLVKPGQTVLCEAATFYGMKALAEHAGFALRGVALDDEGVIPTALEAAIAATGAKVLYLTPTAQNPTGVTMGAQRRRDIAAVLRRHQSWLVEDDIYALFRPEDAQGLEPIATLAPERTFYIGGASKSLAPGLRTGLLVCPPGPHLEAIVRAIRATVYAPSALGGVFFSQWVRDGSAWEMAAAVRGEIASRLRLARATLGLTAAPPFAPHIWLPMSELQAERTANRALRAGAVVTPADAPFIAGDPIRGLRVCLGAEPSVERLALGLQRLAGAMSPDLERRDLGML